MLQERVPDLSRRLSDFVEPDRVRREVYTDPQIFELEMQRIHERVWIYCGHESQIPKAGDYYTVQIGRQPMLMVRGSDGKISVLYNRCPHRGNMMCGDRHGNTGEFFRCSYHAWTFKHDGKLRSIPMMESGYAGTRFGKDNPDCSMKRAARVESYRGFVFASLAADGPDAEGIPRRSRIVAFDDMCDRAPEGEVEVVPNCFRVIQHSNWKIFLENQLDALHPSVVHQSTGRAAHDVEKQLAKKAKKRRGAALVPHALGLRHGDHRQVGQLPDHQLPVRPLRPHRLHGPAAAGPGHARLRQDHDQGVRPEALRGDRRRQHPPRADLSRACRCSRRCSSCARCGRSASTAR